ncbi:MAG: hypothetical protein ACI81T_004714 [Bacteroidia bacterium]|jgi:uncharacterized protein (TIGR02646 family)
MIQLTNKELSDDTKAHLNQIQKGIDSEADFALQAEKAQKAWKSKGNADGKQAFEEVKSTLKEMCVSTEVCNYCEQNEAMDIEHIAPKSFFPNHAFVWENYLLACKSCNTGYKLDHCYVLDQNGLSHKSKRGIEPTHKTHCFINPREEDPNYFLIFNSLTSKYILNHKLTQSEKEKAKSTLEILKLNERPALVEARKSAAKYFYRTIKELTEILNAKDLAELKAILNPYDKIMDKKLSLLETKEELKVIFKKEIQIHQHPSVWYAIKKVDSKTDDKWKALFDQVPEALHW